MNTLKSPLISVVIATRNRSELLKVGIHSVLNQSFKDFELVIVDDGSTDNTEEVVKSIDDPRIVYVRGKGQGISAARNIGADASRGAWTAVHDDDDIMLPNRLEEQARFIGDDVDFIYGAFINFDDETAELQLHHGRNYGFGPALMSGFAPGHSTWLVRTELLRIFRYDEGIESAVDNNITFRMLRSGVRFKHSGVICLLRRVHNGRITNKGGQGQKYTAQLNLRFLKRAYSNEVIQQLSRAARFDWGPVDKHNWETRYIEFLPDHLVKRTGFLVVGNNVPAERGTVQELRILDAEELTWAEYFAACGDGARTNGVSTRILESSEIEEILSGMETGKAYAAKSSKALIAEYALASIQSLKEDEFAGASVLALVVGPAQEWTDEQISVARHRFTSVDDNQKVAGGIIPLKSFMAADGLKQNLFKDSKLEYRVFVDGSADKIREIAVGD